MWLRLSGGRQAVTPAVHFQARCPQSATALSALSRIGAIAVEPGGNYQEALAYAQKIAEEARREAGMLPQ